MAHSRKQSAQHHHVVAWQWRRKAPEGVFSTATLQLRISSPRYKKDCIQEEADRSEEVEGMSDKISKREEEGYGKRKKKSKDIDEGFGKSERERERVKGKDATHRLVVWYMRQSARKIFIMEAMIEGHEFLRREQQLQQNNRFKTRETQGRQAIIQE